MSKKSQALQEFLFTYGWAILSVVIAIGVLLYFGVFSPQAQVNENINRENATQICLLLNDEIQMKIGEYPEKDCDYKFEKGIWIADFDREYNLGCYYRIDCINSNLDLVYTYDEGRIEFKAIDYLKSEE